MKKLITGLALGISAFATIGAVSTPTYAYQDNHNTCFLTDGTGLLYYSKLPSQIDESMINKDFKIVETTTPYTTRDMHAYTVNGTYFNTDKFEYGPKRALASYYIPWTAVGATDSNGNGYLDTEDVKSFKTLYTGSSVLNKLYEFSFNASDESFLFVYPTTYYEKNAYDKNELYNELNSNPERLRKVNETRELVDSIKNLVGERKFPDNSYYFDINVNGKNYTIEGRNGQDVKFFSEAETITPDNIYSFAEIYEGTHETRGNRVYQFLEVDALNDNASTTYLDEYNLPYDCNYRIRFYNGEELVNATLYPEVKEEISEAVVKTIENLCYENYLQWYHHSSAFADEQRQVVEDMYNKNQEFWDEVWANENEGKSNSVDWEKTYAGWQLELYQKEVLGAEKVGWVFFDTDKYYELRKQGVTAKEARDVTAKFSYTKAIENNYQDMMDDKEWYEEQARIMGEENVFETLETFANNIGDWIKSLFETASNGKYTQEQDDGE